MTLPNFSVGGNWQVEILKLRMFVIGLDNTGPASPRSFTKTPSRPVALFSPNIQSA